MADVDVETVSSTLHVLLKHRGDIAKAGRELQARRPARSARPCSRRWPASSRSCGRAGLPVSPTENLDAVEAVSQVPLDDREALRWALATTMVKRHEHRPAFDAVFDV